MKRSRIESPGLQQFVSLKLVFLFDSLKVDRQLGGWLNERKRYGHGFLPFLLMFFVVTRWGSNPENALAYPVSAKHPQSVVTPNCSSFRDWEK